MCLATMFSVFVHHGHAFPLRIPPPHPLPIPFAEHSGLPPSHTRQWWRLRGGWRRLVDNFGREVSLRVSASCAKRASDDGAKWESRLLRPGNEPLTKRSARALGTHLSILVVCRHGGRQ